MKLLKSEMKESAKERIVYLHAQENEESVYRFTFRLPPKGQDAKTPEYLRVLKRPVHSDTFMPNNQPLQTEADDLYKEFYEAERLRLLF